MTSWRQFHPGTYLQQADLSSGPRKGVIRAFAQEKVGDEQKLVLYFQGEERGLVLNKGNCETIDGLYGEDMEGWMGHEVVLYVNPDVTFGGKKTGGIRVRAPKTAANSGQLKVEDRGTHKITTMAPAKMDDGLDDEIGF